LYSLSLVSLIDIQMETFHLFHLASIWYPVTRSSEELPDVPPSYDRPVRTDAEQLTVNAPGNGSDTLHLPNSRIRAASVQMVYAQRDSLGVITPEEVEELEAWVGRAVLDCLIRVGISEGVRNICHPTVLY
jgi:uridine phosphorylase